jgi:hypothetical protein
MSSPFIFIATNRLKAGQLKRERERVPGLVEFIEASEPRLIAFNEYANEAGDTVTVVQIHPEAASMEAHMEIVRERAQQAYAETLDATIRIQVFGRPTDAILETLRQQAGNGVEISVNAEHLGGFTRSAAQR